MKRCDRAVVMCLQALLGVGLLGACVPDRAADDGEAPPPPKVSPTQGSKAGSLPSDTMPSDIPISPAGKTVPVEVGSPASSNSTSTTTTTTDTGSAAANGTPASEAPGTDGPVPTTDVANLPTGDSAIVEDEGKSQNCNPQYVTGGDANGVIVRSGAGSQFESIAAVPNGYPLTVAGAKERYVAVTVKLGTGPAKGFIDKNYLSCDAASAQSAQNASGLPSDGTDGNVRSTSKGNKRTRSQPNVSASARTCR